MVDATWQLEDFLNHRQAGIQLYAVFMRATEQRRPSSTPEGAEMLRQHFLYWWELEEQGKLFGAGPMDAGTAGQIGFCILATADREEAEDIAAAEPFHHAGWRVNTVHSWHLNEGLAVPVGRQVTEID